MGDTRGYLMRLKVRPDEAKLSNFERSHIQQHFDPYAAEVVINGELIDWRAIDEVEVAKAARAHGPSGWLVKGMFGGDRYHVGIYYGAYEAVLQNLTLNSAEYVIRMIAFYAPNRIRYTGVDGLSPLEQS